MVSGNWAGPVPQGNALESYDSFAFSYFAIQIGHTLLPSSNGSLLTLATFASASSRDRSAASSSAAMGDRVGREPAMLWSFGLAIVGFAVIPSYSQIGMAALVLLVIFRLLQGFAVGGEVGPSTAYLIECA